MPNMDWDALEQQDEAANTPAPAGRYVLSVKKATWTASKAGSPMVTVIYQIDEGPHKGKSVWDYIVFAENTVSMARQKLRQLGQDFSTWKVLTEQQQTDSVLGKKVEAELIIDEYKGRKGNKIKAVVRGLSGVAAAGLTPPPPAGAPPAPAKPANPLASKI